jgi:hypothetical protein
MSFFRKVLDTCTRLAERALDSMTRSDILRPPPDAARG